MKNFITGIVALLAIFLNSVSYANWFADIVNRIEITNGINTNILDRETAILNGQKDIVNSEKEVASLMRQVDSSLIGNYGWGTYNFQDLQSYGNGARDWASVLRMAGSGVGDGALGKMIYEIATQFPINRETFNKGITDPNSQKYYVLQSQTALAMRAASQLDYDKIQDQISYQQMLQQQIEKVKDLKGAVDLNNRIQIEANLINLEILRQSALANQQHAIVDQASINTSLAHAKFLTKP